MNEHLRLLKELVLSSFKDDDVKIFIFGSRARLDNYEYSDIDIGLVPRKNINYKTAILKEKLEESNIPFKVDLVDFTEVSDNFREEALKNIAIWRE